MSPMILSNLPRYWGRPQLRLYLLDDVNVINKHADLLAEVGVDFIFIISRIITFTH